MSKKHVLIPWERYRVLLALEQKDIGPHRTLTEDHLVYKSAPSLDAAPSAIIKCCTSGPENCNVDSEKGSTEHNPSGEEREQQQRM